MKHEYMNHLKTKKIMDLFLDLNQTRHFDKIFCPNLALNELHVFIFICLISNIYVYLYAK